MTTYDPARVHGFSGTNKALQATRHRLWELPTERRAELAGMEPGRAPLLPTGLLILEIALELLVHSDFTVTTRGLRFGLVLLLREGRLCPNWSW